MADTFAARLAREMAAWVRDGLITEEQRAKIAARYREAGAPSRFLAILSLVGGALVAAGLALVIAHNWDRLSDATKIGGLVLLLAGFHAGGFEQRERGYGRSGEALLMVGGALFLCGIALVGQIYHLNSRPPNAVLLWLAALLPIAYLLRSAPVLFLGLCGFLVWIGMEAFRSDSLLYLGGLHDAMRWDEYAFWSLLTLSLPLGAGLAAAGALHGGTWRRFQRLFESLGLLVMGAGLYALGFLRYMNDWRGQGTGLGGFALAPVAIFALIALVLMGAAWRRHPADPPRTRAIHYGLMAASVALALAPGVSERLGFHGADSALNLTLLYWVTLLLFSLHLISAGVRWERPGWISLGILLVGLNIVTRYFDVLGSRLDQGLLYIMGGVLILAVSLLLERQRRRFLRQMTERRDP